MSLDFADLPAPTRATDRTGWGTPVSGLAAYLVPRLRSMPDEAAPHSNRRADLALVERLVRSTVSAPVGLELLDRQRHRLMFDIAERYGWTGEHDFLPEWQL